MTNNQLSLIFITVVLIFGHANSQQPEDQMQNVGNNDLGYYELKNRENMYFDYKLYKNFKCLLRKEYVFITTTGMVYNCSNGRYKKVACFVAGDADMANKTIVIELGRTYNSRHYMYNCTNDESMWLTRECVINGTHIAEGSMVTIDHIIFGCQGWRWSRVVIFGCEGDDGTKAPNGGIVNIKHQTNRCTIKGEEAFFMPIEIEYFYGE